MTDYIKRKDALEAVANTYWYGTQSECEAFAHKALDGIHSADVAPVRHGRWDYHRYRYGNKDAEEMGVYVCSVCGHANWTEEDNYCPNCGAKMDGGGEE